MNDAMTITSPEDVGLCSQRLARIDAWRDELVASGRFAGVGYSVAATGVIASGRSASDMPHAKASVTRNLAKSQRLTSPAAARW